MEIETKQFKKGTKEPEKFELTKKESGSKTKDGVRCKDCIHFTLVSGSHGKCLFKSKLFIKNKIPCNRFNVPIRNIQTLNKCNNCGKLTIRKICIECKQKKLPHSKYDKKYYDANKEHILAKNKVWYDENKEKYAIRWKAYHAEHKDKINAKKKETYWANIDENRKINREKAKRNYAKQKAEKQIYCE